MIGPRLLALQAAAAACALLVGLQATRAAELTLDQAASAATARGGAISADAALAIATRWPAANFEAVPWMLLPRESALRLHAKARYLDAVLADLEVAALNEQIAMAYVRFDRARGAAPSAAAAAVALEVQYRDLLHAREEARARQRSARSLLAIATRRPDQIAAELVEPLLGNVTADADDGGKPPAQAMSAATAERQHALRQMRFRAAQLAVHELAAARKRLEHAELVQDEQRASYAQPGTSGLPLGDAMAAVARAQVAVRRAEFRAFLHREIAAALAPPH